MDRKQHENVRQRSSVQTEGGARTAPRFLLLGRCALFWHIGRTSNSTTRRASSETSRSTPSARSVWPDRPIDRRRHQPGSSLPTPDRRSSVIGSTRRRPDPVGIRPPRVTAPLPVNQSLTVDKAPVHPPARQCRCCHMPKLRRSGLQHPRRSSPIGGRGGTVDRAKPAPQRRRRPGRASRRGMRLQCNPVACERRRRISRAACLR